MRSLCPALLLSLVSCLALPVEFSLKNLQKTTAPIEKTEEEMEHENNFSKRIREFQKFLGLNVTGELDSETIQMMHQPRCGLPDMGEFSAAQRRPKWKKTDLTYRILKYTSDISMHEVDLAIERALKIWSDVTLLTFTQVYNTKSDIEISFEVGDHNDFSWFDGPSGVLAHAFMPGPGIGGDTHFDDDEKWTSGAEDFNLFLVAAHEFGHSLGLQHSMDPKALMYPVYKFTNNSEVISQSDRNEIQSLYGERKKSVNSATTEKPFISKSPSITEKTTLASTSSNCQPKVFLDSLPILHAEILFFFFYNIVF